MELRKDPITRSWVVAGHPEREKVRPDPCPLCPENRIEVQSLLDLPAGGQWQVRVYPHFRPLYRIEGEPARTAEGIYDRMAAVGAHEIVVETPEHTRTLERMSDEEIERVLDAWARRIADLKRAF
jgi:UDPglucose--hexose-1-phosphate uridylyltransferase